MRLRISEHKKKYNKARKPGTPKMTYIDIGRYVYGNDGDETDNAKTVRVQRQNKGQSDGVKLEHLFRYMQLFNCTADELIEFNS
jgi:hypothetical protein